MTEIENPDVTLFLEEVSRLSKHSVGGVSIVKFQGFDVDGHFLIEPSIGGESIKAISTIGMTEADVGANVVVAFEKADLNRPIIIGRVQEKATPKALPIFEIDNERVVIRAEREIELRCGDASIVLTRAGKVLIKGNYVLSRSRGANKLKGAYVDIN